MAAYSYTAINTFDQCPRRYYEEKVLKRHPFTETDATRFGNAVHKAIENYVLGQQLDPIAAPYKNTIDTLVSKGTCYPEVRLSVTKEGAPTGYFASDVWMRGQADLVIKRGTDAVVVDWKTGKDTYADIRQVDLMTMMTFMSNPEIEKATGVLSFLTAPSIKHKTYTRDMVSSELGYWQEKTATIEFAAENNAWREKPSGLCKYCPCTTCDYNKQGK